MMNDGIVGEINLLYCGKYKMNITTDKVIIYGILFFFAIFLCQCGLERTQVSGVVEIGTYKEGMTSSVIAPTQTTAAPAPAPSTNTSSSKLSVFCILYFVFCILYFVFCILYFVFCIMYDI
jgi:hypothetical protein